MTTHGKYCDFNFYVTSLDAENGYAATEPMSSGLSLLEAVSEFYKRCGRYPSSTNIMLGVEYTTGRRDLEPAGKGAADLLQRVNGHLHLSRDYQQSAWQTSSYSHRKRQIILRIYPPTKMTDSG